MSPTALNDKTAPPITEQFANDRLDALIAEHGLPSPTDRIWTDYGAQYKSLAGELAMFVYTATEADVERWAEVLGVKATFTFAGSDSRTRPGWWLVTRKCTAEVRGWLPRLELVVIRTETRSVEPMAFGTTG